VYHTENRITRYVSFINYGGRVPIKIRKAKEKFEFFAKTREERDFGTQKR
jgi:hypothetical protein